MYFKTIILDSVIHAAGAAAPTSILTLPLGTRSMLGHLCDRAAEVGCSDFVIVARDERVLPALRALAERNEHDVTVELANGFLPGVAQLEASDRVLLIDPRHWPTAGFDFAMLAREAETFPGALHVVAMGGDATDASERIVKDHDGRIRRVQRFYNQVTQVTRPVGAVSYSCFPAAALADVRMSEIANASAAMAARGILSRDIPVHCDLIDANRAADYLALCEWKIQQAVRAATPPEYSRLSNNEALVGRGAVVHETARLVGPVIVQPNAHIAANATIIGPAIVGRSARIEANALVAQAMIGEGAIVRAGLAVRHRLFEFGDEAQPSGGFEDAEIETFAPVVAETEKPRAKLYRAKRAVDMLASGLGLLVLSPVLALIAILIKLDSRGPVFFVHQREGLFGRVFGCLKFRTMRTDAHAMQRQMLAENDLDGPHFKIARDPRITRLGSFLRKTNLDELPQLWNVFVGHMSLVGPRPSPFRENQICVPWRRARLSVRPGITGIWQICRHEREDGDFQQWIYYDLLYVRNMSLMLDAKILLATFRALVGGKEIDSADLVPPQSHGVPVDWERSNDDAESMEMLAEPVAV